MTVYVDVLWINVFVCCIWIVRLAGIFLQKHSPMRCVLGAAAAGALTECLIMIAAIYWNLWGVLWWETGAAIVSAFLMGLIIRGSKQRKLLHCMLALVLASVFLSGGILAINAVCGIRVQKIGEIGFAALVFLTGAAEEMLLRAFCKLVWSRRLSYGVIINLKDKNYFLRGFCDTGNFLRDTGRKGVWVVAEGKFLQLAEWNPGNTEQMEFTDAAGARRPLECMQISKIWLTGNGGEVKEFHDVTIARGGGRFHGDYDVLLPYDVIWKNM